MGCSLCDITKDLKENNKSLEEERVNIMARKIYERVNNNETPNKKDTKVSCSELLDEYGSQDEKFIELCSGKKKVEVPKVNEITMQDILKPITDPLLIQYQNLYKQMMELKLKPIENMLGYEQVDKQLWQLKDKMYEIEAKYRQSGVSTNSDEDILLAKVNVQRELIPR